MRENNRWLRPMLAAALVGGMATLWGAPASADSITARSGSGQLKIDGVHVTSIQNDEVTFTTSSDTQDERPMSSVIKFSVDDEQAFTAAEEAFANQDWKTAADDYAKAISTTNKAWVKARASIQLMDAAAKLGDFQAAVKGFLAMADRDPELAKSHRPDISLAKPVDLEGAIPLVKTDLDSGNVKVAEQQVLLPFLADLYSAHGDEQSALDTLTKDTQIDPNAAASPLVKHSQAGITLNEANAAVKQSKWQDAINLIESHQAAFIDPAQQADALYYLAEAKEGMASNDNPDSLKDAANAYMTVVALCKNADGKPHVADSLFKAGAILEKLAKPDEAVFTYKQVLDLYKGADDAQVIAQANADIQRLQPPKKSQ